MRLPGAIYQNFLPFSIRGSVGLLVVAALLIVGGAGTAQSQSEGGVSPEAARLKAELAAARQTIAERDALVASYESQRKLLVGSVAEAVRVSEEQMAASRETELTFQALGVDILSREQGALEQRLIKAVRDLDIAQQQLEGAEQALLSLSESFLTYRTATTASASPEVQQAAEQSLRLSDQALRRMQGNGEDEPAVAAGDSQVITVDPSIGLVVFGSGRLDGLRVGTPVTISRQERPIFTAMVVDVRDSIAGALLQEKVADVEEVLVGDGVKLHPNQPNL